jgi:hypothetical protein
VKLILEIENMVLILRIATDLQAMSVEASKLLKGRLLDVKKQAQAWRAWAKEEAKKLALAAEKQKHGNDFPGESRGIKKAGSQMSQSSRALGARDKAGPWEPKPDSTKRKV